MRDSLNIAFSDSQRKLSFESSEWNIVSSGHKFFRGTPCSYKGIYAGIHCFSRDVGALSRDEVFAWNRIFMFFPDKLMLNYLVALRVA